MPESTRINIGCGDHFVRGWFNLDVAAGEQVNVDLLASVCSLPFAENSVDAAYLGHVLEHVFFKEAREALVEVRRVLKSGAEVCVVGPDIVRARALVAQALQPASVIDGVRDGQERWESDRHLWVCSENRIIQLLFAAGFQNVYPVDIATLNGWPVASRTAWQAAVVAAA